MEWTFGDLQRRVLTIYEESNRNFEYRAPTMLIKILGNAVHLERTARKTPEDLSRIDKSLTNVFVWTATLANYGHIGLDGAIGEKYIGGCPRCKQMPCELASGRECIEGLPRTSIPFTIPITIGQWQEHLAQIYPSNFRTEPNEAMKFIAGRLLEEVGELITSADPRINKEMSDLSHYDNPNDLLQPWRGEIADILAWGFAFAEALNRFKGGYSIDKSLREKYKDGCFYCKQPGCICPKENLIFEELHKWEPL